MLSKFKDGIVFGAGFGISFVFIWYLSSYLIYPSLVSSQLEVANKEIEKQGFNIPPSSYKETPRISEEPKVQFYELGPEEKIEEASVIVLANYEEGENGKLKVIMKEFLKYVPGTDFYYSLGDEYKSSSFYPRENTNYGDGMVIFFAGSPAFMKSSMTHADGRIRGMGDMPIELIRSKYK